MAWWDEDQPGVQPDYDYARALASFMGQLAGAGAPQAPVSTPMPGAFGDWANAFPSPPPTTARGPDELGSWFNTFPLSQAAAAPEPAFQELGGYPGLESLYANPYTPPKVDLSSIFAAGATAAPTVDYSRGSGPFAGTPSTRLTFPQQQQTAARQTGQGSQSPRANTGALGAQQGAGAQRAAGYGGQATQGLGGQQTRATSTAYQPYTAGQTGQQTGTSGGATAAGAGGGISPVAGGGVYGAQKWSSSMGSNAVDIFVPRGTPVQAPVSGTLQPGQNGQLILIGDNGLNFAFRHGQTTAQGHVNQGQRIGIVGDPGLDSLGNAPWGNMPDKYQHLEMSISRGSPYFPATPGGGGNVDAAQWLESIGYRGNKISRTPGPPDAQGGGMGMGGYGGTSGGGFNPFAGGMYGLGGGQNPMQMLQGLFGGR